MPLDAVVLTALRAEMESRVVGARIDRIFQPEKDEIVLQLRGQGERFLLLFSANQNNARVHFCTIQKENPRQPPMFCMLMRKLFSGGIIRGISQPPLERLLEFEIDATDEMGSFGKKRLVLELVGRQSNLILLDGEGRIIESLRRVEADLTAKRQILPGMFYRHPPQQEKRNPLEIPDISVPELVDSAPPESRADKWLVDTFSGISPLVAREVCYRAAGETSPGFFEMGRTERSRFAEEVRRLFEIIRTGAAKPYMLLDRGLPHDICYMPVSQYGDKYELRKFDSFSELAETFYTERGREQRFRQRSHEITKTVSAAIERVKRKVDQQKKEYEESKKRERLRQFGDLLMANLHSVEKGRRSVRVMDFYDPEGGETEIALDPRLSPQQNAAKYYKDYNRMKNAEKILREQISSGEQEIRYLESVMEEIARAETDRDINDIREELGHTGYIRQEPAAKKKKQAEQKPLEFRSSGGYTILAGRNNLQNDRLTFREAHKNDIWFHVQKFHGSHVILRCEGKEPDDRTFTEAAMIAVYYSQAKEGQKVPVDYTRVRHVKKPPGARPGMVIYDPYYTAYVTPDPDLIQKLLVR